VKGLSEAKVDKILDSAAKARRRSSKPIVRFER